MNLCQYLKYLKSWHTVDWSSKYSELNSFNFKFIRNILQISSSILFFYNYSIQFKDSLHLRLANFYANYFSKRYLSKGFSQMNFWYHQRGWWSVVEKCDDSVIWRWHQVALLYNDTIRNKKNIWPVFVSFRVSSLILGFCYLRLVSIKLGLIIIVPGILDKNEIFNQQSKR